MCGIALAIAYPGAVADRAVGLAMAGAMAHRGPDALRAEAFEAPLGPGGERRAVALGHARLKVIDLTGAASEPFPNEDGSVQLVFNGEIYNHRALRRGLAGRGHRFRSRCDAEVVLHRYEEDGPEVCASLRGMYGFALVDLARGRVVLARDPAGEKPLYWVETPTGVLAASELPALLAAASAGGPAVRRALCDGAVEAFLAMGYLSGGRSIVEGVRCLLPGETLVWERGRVRRRLAPRFGVAGAAGGEGWPEASAAVEADLDPGAVCAALERRDYAAAVRAAVTDAVAVRLESDVPLGGLLSGGVDSTIVCGLARRLRGELATYSVGFSEPGWDESGYAALAAAHVGADHHALRLGPDAALAIPEIVLRHGEPFADESSIAVHHVAARARRDVTVVLTGDGGDELFWGYRRLRVARLLRGLDRWLPRGLRRWIGARAPGPGARRKSVRRQVWRVLRSLGLRESERYVAWTAIDPAFGAGVVDAVRCHGGIESYDLGAYLPDDILQKTDRQTMAHGLEARAPLCDRVVAALAASLPARAKASRPWRSKEALKAAFPDLLPRPIARRTKMGFGVPFGAWLRQEPLRERVRATLLEGPARDRSWTWPAQVEGLLAEHQSGRADHARRIYALLALELFCRQILDPPAVTPICW